MDLDEYVWKNKISLKSLAKEVEVIPNTLSNLKNRKHTPGLLIAMKLVAISKEKIKYEEILSQKDYKEFKKWLSEKGLKDV